MLLQLTNTYMYIYIQETYRYNYENGLKLRTELMLYFMCLKSMVIEEYWIKYDTKKKNESKSESEQMYTYLKWGSYFWELRWIWINVEVVIFFSRPRKSKLNYEGDYEALLRSVLLCCYFRRFIYQEE